MLSRFKIGVKLTVGFFLIVLLLLVLTGVMLFSYASIKTSTQTVLGTFDRSVKANTCIDNTNLMQQNFLRYLATDEAQHSEEFDKNLVKSMPDLEDIANTSKIPENRDYAKQIIVRLKEAQTQKNTYIAKEQEVRGIMAGGNARAEKLHALLSNMSETIAKSYQGQR
ncbi:MAG: hypothetical protein LBI05_02785, partial [Planctomycetaceae bacterium]|nr:hypothetical protein [Planctomycetaceae bacterium]